MAINIPRSESPKEKVAAKPTNKDDSKATKPVAPNVQTNAPVARRHVPLAGNQSKVKNNIDRTNPQKSIIDNNWYSVGWGIALIVLAFVSIGMTDLEAPRSGRGIIRLVIGIFYVLGPFAPLIGIFLGLSGVLLVVGGLNRVSRKMLLAGGGIVSLLVILVCGVSFISEMGTMFSPERAKQQKEIKDKAALNSLAFKINKRWRQHGQSLVGIRRNGLSRSDVPLALGELAGEERGMSSFLYFDEPMTGIAFIKSDRFCLIAPSISSYPQNYVVTAGSSEAIHGFNLNFRDGELVGMQAIFANFDGALIDTTAPRTGTWLGDAAAEDEFETVTGNGKTIHGFGVFRQGKTIQGFQLVVKE